MTKNTRKVRILRASRSIEGQKKRKSMTKKDSYVVRARHVKQVLRTKDFTKSEFITLIDNEEMWYGIHNYINCAVVKFCQRKLSEEMIEHVTSVFPTDFSASIHEEQLRKDTDAQTKIQFQDALLTCLKYEVLLPVHMKLTRKSNMYVTVKKMTKASVFVEMSLKETTELFQLNWNLDYYHHWRITDHDNRVNMDTSDVMKVHFTFMKFPQPCAWLIIAFLLGQP